MQYFAYFFIIRIVLIWVRKFALQSTITSSNDLIENWGPPILSPWRVRNLVASLVILLCWHCKTPMKQFEYIRFILLFKGRKEKNFQKIQFISPSHILWQNSSWDACPKYQNACFVNAFALNFLCLIHMFYISSSNK